MAELPRQRSHPLQDPPQYHPGGNPVENLKSISHRCHPILVAFVWESTKETIHLPLGCLQGGSRVETTPMELPSACPAVGGEEAAALEATQGQNDSFFSQLPYKYYLEEVAAVGDCLTISLRVGGGQTAARFPCARNIQGNPGPAPRRTLQ